MNYQTSDTKPYTLLSDINTKVLNGTYKNYSQCIKDSYQGNSGYIGIYQLRGAICGDAGYFNDNAWDPNDTADKRTPQWK